MKLIKKTNRNFVVVLLIVLPLACVLLFFTMTYFIFDEVDEKLRVDELRIEKQLETHPEFVSIYPVIEVKEVEEGFSPEEGIKNVFAYDPIEGEEEPFRELTSVKKIKGKFYLIKIRHSILESKDFILAIVISMGAILLLIFLILIVINNRFSLRLWNPFYKNIKQLKEFSFSDDTPLKLSDSEIDEFQDLKESLEVLTFKLQKDYRSLKEFTENASHEIQTPLAIISMNLEEILQEEQTGENYSKIYSCYQSVQRLSKLNEKLLLLAKIDNQQFNDVTKVDLCEVLISKLEELESLIEQRELSINITEHGSFIHSLDRSLANVLVINLLTNAIKYAVQKSTVEVVVSSNSLSVSNSTKEKILSEDVFKRFKKGNDAASSSGLGLAIAKRIAVLSKLEIDAINEHEVFTITVKKI